MKYIKMLGLLAVVAALMAFAGTASAVQLTSPQGTTYTSTIKATSTNSELHGTSWTRIQCAHSSLEGKVESHGGSTAGGKISALNFGSCSNGEVTPIKNAGSFSINSKGEVFSTGTEVKVHASVGECIFTTNNTKVGTFKSSPNSITSATLSMNSAPIPWTGGNPILCGSALFWTGSYNVTTPVPLILD